MPSSYQAKGLGKDSLSLLNTTQSFNMLSIFRRPKFKVGEIVKLNPNDLDYPEGFVEIVSIEKQYTTYNYRVVLSDKFLVHVYEHHLSIALLPCPFCGCIRISKFLDESAKRSTSPVWVVWCEDAMCSARLFAYGTVKDAIKAWNRRAKT